MHNQMYREEMQEVQEKQSTMCRTKEGTIHTVTGQLEGGSGLFFHSHEHLMLGYGRSAEINSALCIDDYEKSLQELETFRAAGGGVIVEAQPVGCGRMAQQLRQLSEESGVKIVASTGFHKMLFYPEEHWNFTVSSEQLTDLYIHELTEGMYQDPDMVFPVHQTQASAGQIKTAMDSSEMDPQYEKMFTAAADAAVETGAPIMVHVENGYSPEVYLEFLLKKGAAPEQLIFCHMDRACADLGLHRYFAQAGVYLEYDTIAREKYHSDEREVEIFREMIESGYGDSLLFSLDTTRQRLKSYGGVPGLDYILNTFVDKLRDGGIAEEEIGKIARENPAKAFCWMR